MDPIQLGRSWPRYRLYSLVGRSEGAERENTETTRERAPYFSLIQTESYCCGLLLIYTKIELSWLLITLFSGYTIGALCLLSKYKGTGAGPNQ